MATDSSIDDQTRSALEKLCVSENITSPTFEFISGSVKGDNYLGVVKSVKVSGVSEGDERSLDLIVKLAPRSEELRKQAPIRKAYQQEIFFYNVVFPMFKKLQEEHNIPECEQFKCVPKCYQTNLDEGDESLVFENITSLGFSMWNRKLPMSKAHVEIVLRAYGKFHALSIALRMQHPEDYASLAGNMFDMYEEFSDKEEPQRVYNDMLRKLAKEICDEVTEADLLRTLETFIEDLRETTVKLKSTEKEHEVLGHGDCWCNNMMFKYEDWDKNKVNPIHISILDWQIIRLGSPVLDLSHFLYNNCGKDVFHDTTHCLDVYYESFAGHLRRLGCADVDAVFSRQLLDEHWAKYSKNGLIISFFMLRVMVSDGEEAPNLSEAVDSGKTIMEAFDYKSKNDDVYKQRLKDVVMHFYDNKWIL